MTKATNLCAAAFAFLAGALVVGCAADAGGEPAATSEGGVGPEAGGLEAQREVGPGAPGGVADGTETALHVHDSVGFGFPLPGDQCLTGDGFWNVDFVAGSLHAVQCESPAPGVPKQMVTRFLQLDAQDALQLRAALGGLRFDPGGPVCNPDADYITVELEGPTGTFEYVNAPLACALGGWPRLVGGMGVWVLLDQLRALGAG